MRFSTRADIRAMPGGSVNRSAARVGFHWTAVTLTGTMTLADSAILRALKHTDCEKENEIMRSARPSATPQQEGPVDPDMDDYASWHIPSPVRRFALAAMPVWQMLEPWLPVVASALITIIIALLFYQRTHIDFQGLLHNLREFVDVGKRYAAPVGLQRYALTYSGYDGQFNFYLARNPGLIVSCAHTPATCPMDNLLLVRMERILYPMLAWAVALGHPQWVVLSLLVVNFAAIVALTFVLERIFEQLGVSRWLAVAGAVYGGNMVGFVRDLSDPVSVLFVALAIYFVMRKHPLWSALAVAGALLTREQAIFYLPFLAVPLIAQRRWRTAILWAILAFGPFVVWQVVLFVIYGKWAIISGDTSAAKLASIPFSGLWMERFRPDFALTVMGVVIPMVTAVLIALLAVARRGIQDLLRDPLPLMIVCYLVLLSFTYWFQWADFRAPSRLAAPGLLLALILVARLPHPGLRASYATMLAITALAPVILVIR